jgi:hypothetical protein
MHLSIVTISAHPAAGADTRVRLPRGERTIAQRAGTPSASF